MTAEAPTPNQAAPVSVPPRTAAERMRQRRRDPEIHQRERKAENLYNEVVREMVARHRDEFRTLLNERRVESGLKPIRMRRRAGEAPRPRPSRAQSPVPTPIPEKQKVCSHTNVDLLKLSYGTFCGECGKRLR